MKFDQLSIKNIKKGGGVSSKCKGVFKIRIKFHILLSRDKRDNFFTVYKLLNFFITLIELFFVTLIIIIIVLTNFATKTFDEITLLKVVQFTYLNLP